MKINSLSSSILYPNTVSNVIKDKKDRDSTHQNVDPDPESSSNQDQNSFANSEHKQKNLDQALKEFETDPQALENGLKANINGSGPGLKVVLTDSQGSVVRQFTGEEFLRMRQSISKEERICGKILDQKL